MSDLDKRLRDALGGAYQDTFGEAPAVLPKPAARHGLAIAAGVGALIVAAGVAVPLSLAHTGTSGTTGVLAAHTPAGVKTGAPVTTGTPVCSAADVKLTAVINHDSFPVSIIDTYDGSKLPNRSIDAFVAYGLLSGTGATACRSYYEQRHIGFVSPNGQYLGDFAAACTGSEILQNRTGAEPVIDPLQQSAPSGVCALAMATPARVDLPAVTAHASAMAPPATSMPASSPCPATGTAASVLPVLAPTFSATGTVVTFGFDGKHACRESDYGVLLSRAGTIAAPASGLGDHAFNTELAAEYAGAGSTAPNVYKSLVTEYANNPYLMAKDGVETGTWKVRVTFGNLTAETPFQVTAG